MASDHITLRISKRWALAALIVIVIPGVFIAGMSVGGSSSSSIDTVFPSTTLVADTTVPVTTTTVSASTTQKKSTPTTVAKKKVATTTLPLTVNATYLDTCPPANTANNRINGTMTISWESTSAVSAMVEVIHGSDFSYKKENHLPNDFVTFTRQCNNVKLANGTYPGTPLTVVFRVTATDASGKSAVDGGSDSM